MHGKQQLKSEKETTILGRD